MYGRFKKNYLIIILFNTERMKVLRNLFLTFVLCNYCVLRTVIIIIRQTEPPMKVKLSPLS